MSWPKGKPRSVETRARISAAMKGRPSGSKGYRWTEEQKENLREVRGGERNSAWKGDSVGYFGLHAWVRRHAGKASEQICRCGQQAVDWANISGEYRRDLNDFVALCRRCHSELDHRSRVALREEA